MWCNAFTFLCEYNQLSKVGSLPKIEYLIDKSTTLAYSEMMFTISLRIVKAVSALAIDNFLLIKTKFHVFDGHGAQNESSTQTNQTHFFF